MASARKKPGPSAGQTAVDFAAQCRAAAAASQAEVDYWARLDRGRGIYADECEREARRRDGYIAAAAGWDAAAIADT